MANTNNTTKEPSLMECFAEQIPLLDFQLDDSPSFYHKLNIWSDKVKKVRMLDRDRFGEMVFDVLLSFDVVCFINRRIPKYNSVLQIEKDLFQPEIRPNSPENCHQNLFSASYLSLPSIIRIFRDLRSSME